MNPLLIPALKFLPTLCKWVRFFTKRKPTRGSVLIIEDNPNDAKLLQYALEVIGYEPPIIAQSYEAARGALSTQFFSIIFADLSVPPLSGTKILSLLSEDAPRSKLIVVCGDVRGLADIEPGVPIVVIRKNVSIEGLTKLFDMLNVK